MESQILHSENETVIIIDIEEYLERGEKHPEHDPGVVIYYRIKVDGKRFDVRHPHINGLKILGLVDKDPSHFNLFQIKHEHGHAKEVEIRPLEIVDLGVPGIERFITKLILYPFFIGQKDYHSPTPELTVRQILEDYAKVDPADKTLAKKIDAGFHEYKNLDEVVSVKDCPHFVLFDNKPTPVS